VRDKNLVQNIRLKTRGLEECKEDKLEIFDEFDGTRK
jgi:hypothetical protein